MNRTLLEKPFDTSQIRQRKGRNGVLDYVEGHSVIQRLNDALDGRWSFEVVQHDVRTDEVVVLGRLTAEDVVKMSFGASQITRERESGQPVSLGDDLKAAATDALKKCATFLGVGLHLYADKPLAGRAAAMRAGAPTRPPGPPGTPPSRPASPTPPARPSPNGNGADYATNGAAAAATRERPAGTNGADRVDRLTPRQLDAIAQIAFAKGIRPPDIDAMSLRAFNRKPGELTRAEASSLIKELSSLKRQRA